MSSCPVSDIFTWLRNMLIVLVGIFTTYWKSVTNRKNWFWYNRLFHQQNFMGTTLLFKNIMVPWRIRKWLSWNLMEVSAKISYEANRALYESLNRNKCCQYMHGDIDTFDPSLNSLQTLSSGIKGLPGVLWWTLAMQTEHITERETKTIENIRYFDTSGMSVEVLFWFISLDFMRILQN